MSRQMPTRFACHLIAVAVATAIPVSRASIAAGAGRADLQTATFAGGCFWSMVHPFDTLPGVVSVVAGYTGGALARPTYSQVSSGGTGHAEAVEIRYDPTQISYGALLQVFWHTVDPLDASGQFCDRGEQYRSEIFYHDSAQLRQAQASETVAVHRLKVTGAVVTQIVSAGPFYVAEDYHQEYYKRHAIAYGIYKWGCGRDKRERQLWGPVPENGGGPATKG